MPLKEQAWRIWHRFCKRWQKNPNIKVVSMDMNSSFIASLKEYLPDVLIVFDRYHIMAQMSRAIDSLRHEHSIYWILRARNP
ncbi:MAG: hypothetical protein D3910_14725 [Candidatus Electrothrix sp. ATG2]|nr:hypothetical protein [Candidatus Electrothrix sp. ATG2]